MATLQTIHSPELKGLYASSNRFTQPKGTVPRISNLYMVRRGAFHTVPGSQWISSWNGLPPSVTTKLPLLFLKWYSPSSGSSPDAYLSFIAAPNINPHNYLVCLQLANPPTTMGLIDVSGPQFVTLATSPHLFSSETANIIQMADYLVIAFGNTVPPNIFPTVTQTTQAVGISDTTIDVNSTLPFPNQGTILIDAELIAYTDKTSTSFSGLTRGAYGSSAATHLAGAQVYLDTPLATSSPISTTLSMAMLSSDTTADVVGTALFPQAAGYFLVDSECIGYSGVTATSFTNLVRGLGGTTAAGHLLGATVFSVVSQPGNNASGNTGVAAGPVVEYVTGAISAGAGSVTIGSTQGFPQSGYVVIGAECIQYTGITPRSLTGLVRAQQGTTAASHANGTPVFLLTLGYSSTGIVWSPILNQFDPTTVYGGWPGTQNDNSPSAASAVNIGTVIVIFDGAGTPWLFRAQNSGVTGWGKYYVGPQFFPNGLIGTDATMTLNSTALHSATGGFTQAMATQQLPIAVVGASSDEGTLYANIVGFTDTNNITLSVPAGTAVTTVNFTVGIGHFGDSVPDKNTDPTGGTADGYNSGTEVWLNIGQANLSPPGAAFAFQHLNYLFLWGVGIIYGPDGLTGPDALWQSNFGAPLIFDPTNTTFAGKGDGTTAQGGAVYSLSEAGIAATPQLVLFKDASTYSFLNEFPNASLVEVSGGLGCIAPNTIQFIGGYGVMRLSYAGVTLFDGQLEHVTEYTDAIRGYLFGTIPGVAPVDFTQIQSCVSTQSVNPPFYMFFAPLVGGDGKVTRGFGYDFGLKQWFIMDLPFPITAAGFLPQAVVALSAGYQSVIGGANDGTVRRIFAGDPDWDGTPIQWSTRLPDWGFPGTPTYVRRCNLFITADGGGAAPKLTKVLFSGTRRSSQGFSRAANIPSSILGSIDIGETVLSGGLAIEGQGQVLLEGSDAQTSEKPTGRTGL